MATLHYIGDDSNLTNFKHNSSVEELCNWYRQQTHIQFDTETNVVKSIVERELKVLQFGDILGPEHSAKDVYVVQWSFLSDEDKDKVRDLLRIITIMKIIHNASFDYQMMLKENVVMDNVWDTMVMEQCIYPGYDYDLRFFALAETLLRRYHIDVSKEQQGNFGDDIITDEKLIYAATDVVHLGKLRHDQRLKLIEEDTIQLGEGYWNENEAVLVFADIEYNGMGFDPVKWRENIAKAEPIVREATIELNNILLQEPYLSKAQKLLCNTKLVNSEGKERTVEVPCILPEDIVTVNWGSAIQAVKLLQYVFPDLEKASALELKKYLQINDVNSIRQDLKTEKRIKELQDLLNIEDFYTNPENEEEYWETERTLKSLEESYVSVTSKQFNEYINTFTKDKFVFIKLLIAKKTDILEEMFILNFKDRMIEDKYLLPKNTVCINWNSNNTKLEIFRWFNPKCENTDADTVEDNILLPLFKFYKQYNNANSLVTKFGESFIEKYVNSDGRVRTRFNTILSTGRVSSSSANMQQIPANALPEDRQNDYRNCFTPGKPGWKVVGADAVGQELTIIGTLSQDPVFLDALKTGKDLHSVCAELIYGDKWKDAQDEDCKFYALKDGEFARGKCSCKGHKKLRNTVKSLNFGLAYGLSPKGLAADLDISLEEATELFDTYFETFPAIKGLLDSFGNFGKLNGYIRTTAPWRRKRYFPYWRGADTAKNMLAQIERASKNMPIQGLGAEHVKIVMIELRRWINKENLRNNVQLFMQVHDQVDIICKEELCNTVTEKLVYTMEKSAEVILKNTLMKAEVQISDVWQK